MAAELRVRLEVDERENVEPVARPRPRGPLVKAIALAEPIAAKGPRDSPAEAVQVSVAATPRTAARKSPSGNGVKSNRPKPVPLAVDDGEISVRIKPPAPPPLDDDAPVTARLLFWLKSLPQRMGKSGMVSTVVHAVLIIILGLMTISHERAKPPVLLVASSSEDEANAPLEQIEPLKVETPVEKVEVATAIEAAPETVVDPLPSAAAAPAMGDAPSVSISGVGLGSMDMAGLGKGMMMEIPAAPAPAKPAVGKTMFFGVARKGNKFAYIIDNSGSMRGRRFDAAREELFRSVSQMTRYQAFYVIFFSDRAYPMFDPEAAKEMLPPEPKNLKKLLEWMQGVEVTGGGRIVDAVELALKQKPDAIFLLTDGLMSEYSAERLMKMDTKDVSINTICFGSEEGAATLKKIADKQDGVFQFIPNP